jgi:hypothetical protein
LNRIFNIARRIQDELLQFVAGAALIYINEIYFLIIALINCRSVCRFGKANGSLAETRLTQT